MSSLDFETDDASDGQVALDKIARTDYDVVLLDWNMPDIAGVALVRALRERESTHHLPVLMVTQNVEPEHIAEALAAGVDEYLMKPFTAKALREKLLLMGVLHSD